MHPPAGSSSGEDQRRLRNEKRLTLNDGAGAYPSAEVEAVTVQVVREKYADIIGQVDARTGQTLTVVGRLMQVRNSGKLCFAVLQDGDSQIQLMLSAAVVGAESLAEWKRLVDRGDFVQVTGEIVTSTRGELSILGSTWSMLSKALRPLPNTYTDLNEETAARQPYLNLILNEKARGIAQLRSRIVSLTRRFFEDGGYCELETPMLQVQPGGANARPFTTKSNAYNTELYLRIAVELYLKRAIIGGFDRVFEIGRNFRNEGADRTHSPEFTMLEAYQAYADYFTMKDVTVQLIQHLTQEAFGSTCVDVGGTVMDFTTFDSIDLFTSLSNAVRQEIAPTTSKDVLIGLAAAAGLDIPASAMHGKFVEELWEHHVKPQLTTPTFVMNFPADTSPLTAPHRSRPGVAEKWDLYVNGTEIATGYSELIDPVLQREKFEQQALAAANGDPEAMQVDEEFLTALEHGMPPTGGIGIGIDRLLMAFTGLGIRDIQLFPFIRS